MGSTCLILLVAVAVYGMAGLVVAYEYNVVDHGAIGDGVTNDTKAFIDTWKKACADDGSPTILVPSGMTFLMGPLQFHGPCNSSIHFQVDGNLLAPSKMWTSQIKKFGQWIKFSSINGLVIDGCGQFNGSGEPWWQYYQEETCSPRPDGVAIFYSSKVRISGLRFVDSPKKHLKIENSVDVHISNLTITAPGTSPNTDGIHIEESTHVRIMDLTIGTGDDCISIGNGTFHLNITRILCGPGHGISIGSLGKDDSEATVGQIHVSDCNLFNTTNGVRIKTWPGRSSGYAKGITFKRINFTAVENPIIIDQFYCDAKCHSCPTEISDLQVSDISYSGLMGSAVGATAITLNCSSAVGCPGISMVDVDIQSINGTIMENSCLNAKGTLADRVSPPIRCAL